MAGFVQLTYTPWSINTGAYGEHGPTTVGLSGHKSIPLYGQAGHTGLPMMLVYIPECDALQARTGDTEPPRVILAVESAVNELAARIAMDPVKLREMNMVREGQVMPAYYNETATSCALNRCMEIAKEMIGWDEKYPCRDMGNGKVRSVGVAMAMQGLEISGVDVGSATIKMNEEGYYTLSIGAADMGTGCDTILAQMAAECMECSVDDIAVLGADTDSSPYDSGSYASSTTYVTGKAVEKACQKLKEQIKAIGAELLETSSEEVEFDGTGVFRLADQKRVSLQEIGTKGMCGNRQALTVTESNSFPSSPPPFMVGMVEIELDKETGHVEILDYAAVVDCGTVVNPNLARVQTEGGLAQGIGMALYENVQYNDRGSLRKLPDAVQASDPSGHRKAKG